MLIAFFGALLPKEHLATRSARLQQPPQAIWSAITDYQKFPEWRKSVARVEPLPPVNGKPAWREYDQHKSVIPYEISESVPPERLVTRITDPNLPFGGSWTFEIAPLGGGSSVRITENGEVRNTIFRFLARFVFGYESSMNDYLKSLGAKFGETITPEK